jgi:CRP-like cAMP-binding protein
MPMPPHHQPDFASSSDALMPCTSRKTPESVDSIHHTGYGASCAQAMPSSRARRNQNQLLAALPAGDFERLSRHLELVPLRLGQMLYEPSRRMEYAYFPTTSVVSLHYVMETGDAAEAAGVGNEGVVGISLVMGVDTTSSLAVVQTAGQGYRLPGRLLQQEFDRAGVMQRLLLRYTQALIAQTVQTAACNQHHLLEQRLCRFLLLTLDRVHSPELVITHELISSLLGTRREGIGLALENLRRAGLVSWRRGHITVLKRSGLEARACECYSVVKTELGRLRSVAQDCRDLLHSEDHVLPHEEFDTGSSQASMPTPHANWRRHAEVVHKHVRM